VEVSRAPSLLPILRSQQQATILALVLGDPEVELSLTAIAERTGVPLSCRCRRCIVRSLGRRRPGS
jgi:hypothetical protein